MANHPSILAWKNLWAESLVGCSPRVINSWHDWATNTQCIIACLLASLASTCLMPVTYTSPQFCQPKMSADMSDFSWEQNHPRLRTTALKYLNPHFTDKTETQTEVTQLLSSERLLLNHERCQDSWPPEKNSIRGQRQGLIAQSFCAVELY